MRKQDLQLQLPRQTGQDSAISSSDILGYLEDMKEKNGNDVFARTRTTKSTKKNIKAHNEPI